MPIATHSPEEEVYKTPEQPKSVPVAVSTIIVDDKVTPLTSLLSYVDGAPWTVNYYSQIVNRDTELKDLDTTQSGIYQQYRKIVDLEIRVSNPLTSNQNNDQATTVISGSGLIYPFLVPNVGDVFIAEAGRSKGLFRVTNVERKSFNRDSVYEITYEMAAYATPDNERVIDVEKKTIRTYYFNKSRLVEGLNPLLIEHEQQELLDLNVAYRSLCQQYFKLFFNREFCTLVLPGQMMPVYDSFLVQYLFKIVDQFDAPELRLIKNLSTEHEDYLSQPQFWTALINRDANALKFCNKFMGLSYAKSFGTDPMFNGLAFSGITYIVYPTHVDQSTQLVIGRPGAKPISTEVIQPVESAPIGLADLVKQNFVDTNETIPYIKPVLVDDHYVFSKNFYDYQYPMSVLELLTMDYLMGRAIDNTKLCRLIERQSFWGRLEQFYYTPILLTLIKAALSGIY